MDRPISFITGATGFLGSAVVRQLLQRGHKIRALCRAGNDRQNIAGLDVEVIEGDLANPQSYRHALVGCDALFHVAADYRIWVPDEKAMNRINIDGTRDLMVGAQIANIKRIVYTSSVATLGINIDGTPANEETPVTIKNMVGIYKKSKFLAEQLVQNMIAQEGLPAIIVNPSTPIGPRDIKPTPTGRIITEMANGKIPAFVDTGLNVAHVDDVALGHILAFDKGMVGERYILGGQDMSLRDILAIVARLSKRKAPTIQLPRGPLYPLALGAEIFARITGREPFLTIDALRMSRKKMFFTSSKAMQNLGYSPRAGEFAIADAYQWFHEHDYC